MKTFTFAITLIDGGLPYKDKEEAQRAAEVWAQGIAFEENCLVGEVKVTEDE